MRVAHQQVFAVVVEDVHVVARQRGGQARAHFARKHSEAQPLRLAYLILMPGPGDMQAGRIAGLGGQWRIGRVRPGKMQRALRQHRRRQGGGGQFVQARSLLLQGVWAGFVTTAWQHEGIYVTMLHP